MTQENNPDEPLSPESLRARLAADIAAGKTVALTPEQMADPQLRAKLPQLLDTLGPIQNTSLRIPGYTILGEIGHGGMSTVYLARQDALDRHVALKVVPNWLGGQQRARERLLSEARALARLSHPHIVTIHDVIDRGDCVAIAMEWIDGMTLAGLLRELPPAASERDIPTMLHALGASDAAATTFGPTALHAFVRMLEQVARAVQFVHDNRLLHLDIKPSNVLVRRDGTPLLADFGVVREIDRDFTHTRSYSGTPVYSSPEQLARADDSINQRTDVYGLGITLYELLARDLPLRHDSLTKLLQRVQTGRIPTLHNRPQIPTELATIVHRAIAPEPARRYPSAAAFADDLQAWLTGQQISAKPYSRFERLQNWQRAEPWKAVLAIALSVLVPVCTALGVKLVQEQPRIDTARQLELAAKHAEITHAALLGFLIRKEANEQDLKLLTDALAVRPTDPGLLATLVGIASQDHRDLAKAAITAAQRHGGKQLGLQLAAQRMAEGRQFFSPTELAQIANSHDELDIHLRLVDRVLWTNATSIEEEAELLAADLDREVLVSGPHPLLHGMRAWIASWFGDERMIASSCDAIERKWPNQEIVHMWRIQALQNIDPNRAIEAADRYLALHPQAIMMPYVKARCVENTGNLKAALELLDQIPLRRETLQTVTTTRVHLLHKLGRPDEACDVLVRTYPSPAKHASTKEFLVDLGRRDVITLTTLALFEPAAAMELYRERGFAAGATLYTIQEAIDLAGTKGDWKTAEEFALRGHELFPEHHTFRWRLADMRCRRKDYAGASEITRGMLVSRRLLDYFGTSIASIRMHEKDWEGLLQHAERWYRWSTDRKAAAAYYRGLALARLGQSDNAIRALEEHLELAGAANRAAEQAGNSRRFNYREAHLELLWLELQSSPADQRKQLLETSDRCRHVRPMLSQDAGRSAWWSLMQAEVLALEERPAEAKAAALRARRLLDQPALNAPANLAELVEAAIQRFQ
jgi:serine/threonine protein kinase